MLPKLRQQDTPEVSLMRHAHAQVEMLESFAAGYTGKELINWANIFQKEEVIAKSTRLTEGKNWSLCFCLVMKINPV